VSVADRHKLTTAGIFLLRKGGRHLQTHVVSPVGTLRNFLGDSITMLAAIPRMEKANYPDVSQQDPALWPRLRHARLSNPPARAKFPGGKYTVILEPAAVLDMGLMFFDFGGCRFLISVPS